MKKGLSHDLCVCVNHTESCTYDKPAVACVILVTFLEIGDTRIIVELLKKGQGISFLPKIAAVKEMKSQKIDVINVENWNVVMWKQIIYHKNKYVTPQMSAFINMIMQKQQ